MVFDPGLQEEGVAPEPKSSVPPRVREDKACHLRGRGRFWPMRSSRARGWRRAHAHTHKRSERFRDANTTWLPELCLPAFRQRKKGGIGVMFFPWCACCRTCRTSGTSPWTSSWRPQETSPGRCSRAGGAPKNSLQAHIMWLNREARFFVGSFESPRGKTPVSVGCSSTLAAPYAWALGLIS